ncbi:predicted protein, partial [Nematostella vectensis]
YTIAHTTPLVTLYHRPHNIFIHAIPSPTQHPYSRYTIAHTTSLVTLYHRPHNTFSHAIPSPTQHL